MGRLQAAAVQLQGSWESTTIFSQAGGPSFSTPPPGWLAPCIVRFPYYPTYGTLPSPPHQDRTVCLCTACPAPFSEYPTLSIMHSNTTSAKQAGQLCALSQYGTETHPPHLIDRTIAVTATSHTRSTPLKRSQFARQEGRRLAAPILSADARSTIPPTLSSTSTATWSCKSAHDTSRNTHGALPIC